MNPRPGCSKHVRCRTIVCPNRFAGEVYDLKKTAQQQRNRILADSSISPEQRIAALQSVQTETDAAVAARLGDRAYQQYRTGSGRWIQSLGKISTPPAAGP